MSPSDRHFGLDWLRIGAFALLIGYHVAMVFAPAHWVIKAPVTVPALIAPMALLTPWRLPLLFVVSGFASRRLFARQPGVASFMRERAARLLVPLAFALVALLPPELWVRERLRGYDGGFLQYWAGDYWSVVPIHGLAFPSVEHLWFVVYLFAYTVVIAALAAWRGIGLLDPVGAWLAERRRLLWAPLALLVTAKLALLFVVPEEHGLFTDWAGHAEYFPLFAFGFLLGGPYAPWAALSRTLGPALALAAIAGAIVVLVELAWPDPLVPPHLVMALDRAARLAMAWAMIVVLLDVATRWWNRDHRWRPALAEAVFPAYIVHHPVLIVLAWWLLPLGLPNLASFALLLAGTAFACWATYRLGREIAWLRPLIGLSRHAARRRVGDLRPA